MAENNGRTTLGGKLNELSLMDWLKIGGLVFGVTAAVVAYYYGVKDSIAQNQRNHAAVLAEISSIRADMTEVVQTGRDQLLDIRNNVSTIADQARKERDEIEKRLSNAEIVAIKYDITKTQLEQQLQQLSKQMEALNDYIRRSFPSTPSSVPDRR